MRNEEFSSGQPIIEEKVGKTVRQDIEDIDIRIEKEEGGRDKEAEANALFSFSHNDFSPVVDHFCYDGDGIFRIVPDRFFPVSSF